MVELFLVTHVLKGGYEVVVLSLLYGVHKAKRGQGYSPAVQCCWGQPSGAKC